MRILLIYNKIKVVNLKAYEIVQTTQKNSTRISISKKRSYLRGRHIQDLGRRIKLNPENQYLNLNYTIKPKDRILVS